MPTSLEEMHLENVSYEDLLKAESRRRLRVRHHQMPFAISASDVARYPSSRPICRGFGLIKAKIENVLHLFNYKADKAACFFVRLPDVRKTQYLTFRQYAS